MDSEEDTTMKRITLTRVSGLFLTALMTGGALAEAPLVPQSTTCSCQIEDWNFPAEASRLLEEIQTTAGHLSRATDALESYHRGRLSWQSHARELTAARTHINAIGERLTRLQTIREVAAPWQRQALD